MNILLDTHLTIWAINDDAKLTEKARAILLGPDNNLFYSAATVIEIDWKIRSRKNNLDFTVDEFIEKCQKSQFAKLRLRASTLLLQIGLFGTEMIPNTKTRLTECSWHRQ